MCLFLFGGFYVATLFLLRPGTEDKDNSLVGGGEGWREEEISAKFFSLCPLDESWVALLLHLGATSYITKKKKRKKKVSNGGGEEVDGTKAGWPDLPRWRNAQRLSVKMRKVRRENAQKRCMSQNAQRHLQKCAKKCAQRLLSKFATKKMRERSFCQKAQKMRKDRIFSSPPHCVLYHCLSHFAFFFIHMST